MNEKVKELLEELKDSAKNPTVIYATFDGSDEEEFENDKLLTPESCKLLFNHITKLNNNWNELKKFVDERIKFIQEEKAEFEEDLYNDYETNIAEITIRRCNLSQLEDVQEKMQELEGKNNNEEESNSK